MDSKQLGLSLLIISFATGVVLIGSNELHREYMKKRVNGQAKRLVSELKGQSDPAARARFAGEEIAEREGAHDKTKWERMVDSLRPPVLDGSGDSK